jgi:hypothetical protein
MMPFGRGATLTAASIMFIVFGAVWIVYSIIPLIAGFLPSLAGTLLIGDFVSVGVWISAAIGIALLIPSILCLVAGYLIWKRRRSGGILGIALAAILIAVNGATIALLQLGTMVVGAIGVVIFVLAIVLVAVGWKRFQPSWQAPWPPS